MRKVRLPSLLWQEQMTQSAAKHERTPDNDTAGDYINGRNTVPGGCPHLHLGTNKHGGTTLTAACCCANCSSSSEEDNSSNSDESNSPSDSDDNDINAGAYDNWVTASTPLTVSPPDPESGVMGFVSTPPVPVSENMGAF